MKQKLFLLIALMMGVSVFAGETSEVVSKNFIPIGATVIDWILGVFGSTISMVLIAVLIRFFNKLGIEKNKQTEDFIKGIVAQAVNWVEKWAKTQENKPSSQDKLKKAIEKVEEFAKLSGVQNFVKEKIEAMIEIYLREHNFLS